MQVVFGQVVDGRIVVNDVELEEGADVIVVVHDEEDEPISFSAAEQEELFRLVRDSEPGTRIDAHEWLAERRRRR